jgi:hypothetical protein
VDGIQYQAFVLGWTPAFHLFTFNGDEVSLSSVVECNIVSRKRAAR